MKRIMISVLLVLLLLPSGCNKKPRRIVIGIALTATYHPATQLAVREINAHGGIDGVPVELTGLDWKFVDSFNPEDILRWAAQFTEEKDLVAVIGHSDSASTLSAAAFYNQHKVPQIVTIATNPAITNIGDWTFRLCLSDASQGPALAEYAVKDWGKRRIAVIYVNDDYGRGLAYLFEKHVRELGGEIVASIIHRNALAKDDEALIRSSIMDLKRKGEPDLVVLFQRLAAARFTLKTLREAGLGSSILGGDSLGPPSFAKANPELTEGIHVSQFFQPRSDDPRTTQFLQDFRTFAGHDADYGDAFAYDAVYLVRDAARYGGPTRAGIKSYLDRLIREKVQTDGIAGVYVLGPDHDARRALYIAEVRNGAQTFLKTLGPN